MSQPQPEWLPGVQPADSIARNLTAYELECSATDPEQRLERAMQAVLPWEGRTVLDIGCASGFHLLRFAESASHVFGVEPDDLLRLKAMKRVAYNRGRNVSVLTGSAERLLLADSSIDVAHARFAYFWGPGSEAGMAELERVVSPGGAAFIIDLDFEQGTYGRWLSRIVTHRHGDEQLARFWIAHGFAIESVESELSFESREDLELVILNELGEAVAKIGRAHV